MDTASLKIVLTPVLVGAASMAGRRWGPSVGGWLVGLPFTSGPITLFLVLDHGAQFAATVAAGTLAGTLSQAAFCLAYAWTARRGAWPLPLTAGLLGFAVSTLSLERLSLGFVLTCAVVIAGLVVALAAMPVARDVIFVAPPALPAWDIPARMIVATVFVVLLTGLAARLGPELTGLLAPFTLYAAILTVFGHHLGGAAAAVRVLRGLLLGLFAFAGFFLVLAFTLERMGTAAAFGAAIAIGLAIQATSLWILRRESTRPEELRAP
jgi:hypothetical protein